MIAFKNILTTFTILCVTIWFVPVTSEISAKEIEGKT